MRKLTKADLDPREQAPSAQFTDEVDQDTGHKIVEISESDVGQMGEYSCSLPSGIIVGKRWLRHLDAFSMRNTIVNVLDRARKGGWLPRHKRLLMGEYGEEFEREDKYGRKEEHIKIHWHRIRVVDGRDKHP